MCDSERELWRKIETVVRWDIQTMSYLRIRLRGPESNLWYICWLNSIHVPEVPAIIPAKLQRKSQNGDNIKLHEHDVIWKLHSNIESLTSIPFGEPVLVNWSSCAQRLVWRELLGRHRRCALPSGAASPLHHAGARHLPSDTKSTGKDTQRISSDKPNTTLTSKA